MIKKCGHRPQSISTEKTKNKPFYEANLNEPHDWKMAIDFPFLLLPLFYTIDELKLA